MWVSLPSSALSQLASQLCWVGDRPVNHPDLNDPKGPASLDLGQFGTSFWLFVDGFFLVPCMCVCLFVCVFMETAFPFRYITASVVQYQTREGELVRLSSWDLLVLSCQGEFRNFDIVWRKENWRGLIVGVILFPALQCWGWYRLFRVRLGYKTVQGSGFCCRTLVKFCV